jgi:phosphoglycerate dehydrogenase-like enzyme
VVNRLRVALSMRPASLMRHLFDEAASSRLEAAAQVHPTVLEDLGTPEARAVLAQVDVLITGWGAPVLTDEVISAAPRLKAVVSTSGGAGHLLGNEARSRGLLLTNARVANSRPVAEYALAMILLAGKRVFPAADLYARRRGFVDRELEFPDAGNHGRLVGIVGASTTGRLTIELLRPFDLPVAVYDPYLTDAEAKALGVRKLGLDDLMGACTVVSVHVPGVPETLHLIGAAQVAAMPDGATLVNTARGSVVDTDALVAELATGRIAAILDVTEPEPLPADHPLWSLPNVLLTPHVAGSMGNELHRLGESAVAEVERLAAGLPPLTLEAPPEE